MASAARAFTPHLLLQFAKYRWLLAGMDLLAVNGALLAVLSLQSGAWVRWQLLTAHPLWFVLASALWLFLASACDVYELGVADRFPANASAATKACVLTILVYLVLLYPAVPFHSSLAVLSLPVLTVAGLLSGRVLCALVVRARLFQRRALIIGTGETARAVAHALSAEGRGTYRVIGFIDGSFDQTGVAITLDGREGAPERDGQARATPPVFRDAHAIAATAARHDITTLVLATPQNGESTLLLSLADCAERGTEVAAASSLYEQLRGRVPVEKAGTHWYVDLPIEHAGTSPLLISAKRALDVLLAGVGLLGLGLILPFIALAIYLDSPGPIFYAQERVGRGGRTFRIFKFRSMVPDAERGQPVWAQKDDARITRVGRILRATYLDELPQFMNVLRGEMSAVGPRPERPEFIRALVAQVPLYRLRHAIKPGMAGWALVKHGYARTNHDALMRLEYDFYYMKHQCLWLDVVIIAKAIGRAMAFKGR